MQKELPDFNPEAFAALVTDIVTTLVKEKTKKLEAKNKRMREAIEYLLNTSGPMTPQQKECWPALEQTLKDKNVSDT